MTTCSGSKAFFKLLTAFALLLGLAPAHAAFIAYGDFNPGATIYDFNSATVGAATAGDGFLSLSDGEVRSNSPGSTGLSYSNVGNTNPPPGGPIRFDFAGLVSAVGFNAYYNNNPVLFQVFDAGNNLLESISMSPTNCGSICGFIGLDVGANLISYAIASVPNVDGIHNLYVDDIIYQTAVPEPVSLALLGLGLSGLGFSARRRRQ